MSKHRIKSMSQARQSLKQGDISVAVSVTLEAESHAREVRAQAQAQARARLEGARLRAQSIEQLANARIKRSQVRAAALAANRIDAIGAAGQKALAALADKGLDRDALVRAVRDFAACLTGAQASSIPEPER